MIPACDTKLVKIVQYVRTYVIQSQSISRCCPSSTGRILGGHRHLMMRSSRRQEYTYCCQDSYWVPHQSPSHTSTCDSVQYEYSTLSENIKIVGNIRTVLGLDINFQTLLTFPDKVAGAARSLWLRTRVAMFQIQTRGAGLGWGLGRKCIKDRCNTIDPYIGQKTLVPLLLCDA